MSTLDNLKSEFEHFENLHPDRRKDAIHAMEARVRSGKIALTHEEFNACTTSPLGLQRILAYLMVQEGHVPATVSVLRSNLEGEMERLKRARFEGKYSRMPLYYAARAFVGRVKTDESLLTSAVGDLTLLEQVAEDLSRRHVDYSGQVLPKINEAISLLRGAQDKTPETALTAARISRRGAIAAALIALIGAIVAALINTLLKQPEQTPARSGSGTAQPPDGAER
jgi:hypothetical protein